MEPDEIIDTSGVTISISGADNAVVGMVATAVNFGMVECGFENVAIAVPPGVTCHAPDNNLAAIMRHAKENDPTLFQIEADIIINVGEDDEEPEAGDVLPRSEGGDDELETEVE